MKFELLIKAFNLPVPVAEYRFHPVRKWRFDYAWPDKKVAMEIDGGVFKKTFYKDKKTGQLKTHVGGRHNTGKGYLADMEKMNTASSEGWRILKFTPQQLNKTETIELIKKTLNL